MHADLSAQLAFDPKGETLPMRWDQATIKHEARDTLTEDHPVALRRYEELLRPYVTTAQKLPPGGIGGFAPLRALDIRLHLAGMRLMTRWPVKKLVAGQFAKAGDIRLTDYEPAPAR